MFPISHFNITRTPFYYYDKTLLSNTLAKLIRLAGERNYHIHYAVKANANPEILKLIAASGIGADCVSGGEIKAALEAGFPAKKIVFAGVGKADWEIEYALEKKIFCFNVESAEELSVIEELAKKKENIASIALRINPNIDAHTHEYITTGLSENKFGIPIEMLDSIFSQIQRSPHVQLVGFHFHIGSQILNLETFHVLCERINQLQDDLSKRNIQVKHINVGGGLGVDYENPDKNPIPDFGRYFDIFQHNLNLRGGQQLHFELGRSIVCQCGSLITRVLYVKKGIEKQFVIVDAGMTDLIRPALYQALGIFLPLITTNCAVLGVAILLVQKNYNLLQSFTYAVSTAVGFALALVVFSGIRERLELNDVPKAMRGVPVALVTAGILAMAFMGFAGLV